MPDRKSSEIWQIQSFRTNPCNRHITNYRTIRRHEETRIRRLEIAVDRISPAVRTACGFCYNEPCRRSGVGRHYIEPRNEYARFQDCREHFRGWFDGADPESADVGPTNAFWRRIERMLAEIAALAKFEPIPPDFPARVLVLLHNLLPAPGGIFWIQDRNGRLRQAASYFPGELLGDPQRHCIPAFDEMVHLRLVRDVLEDGTARLAPLEMRHDAETPHSATLGRNGTLLLCPIKTEGGCTAVLEVIHDDVTDLNEQLLLDVLRSVAELCADYLRRFQLTELTQERTVREKFAQFTRRVHDSLDPAVTAYAIANEGRHLIGCDRVSVLACRGTGCRTLAVSGAASWDRRSNTIAGLERLASVVAVRGEPLVFHEGTIGLPPQVRVPLEAYLEHVQARNVIVAPLSRRTENGEPGSRPVGVLIVEQFSGILDESTRQRAAEVCESCTPALAHALEVQRIPWARFFRDRDWRSWLRRGRVALVRADRAGRAAAGSLCHPD